MIGEPARRASPRSFRRSTRIEFHAHRFQIGLDERHNIFQIFQISPCAARYMSNVATPCSPAIFLGSLLEPELDDEGVCV